MGRWRRPLQPPSTSSDLARILGFLVYQTFNAAREKTSKATNAFKDSAEAKKEDSEAETETSTDASAPDQDSNHHEEKNMDKMKMALGDAASSLTRAVQVQI